MNNAPMLKAYVTRSKYRDESKDGKRVLDVGFDSHPEKANPYDTRGEAENDCNLIFNRSDIEIDSSEGGKHTLKNFRVEQIASGEFVIFCEGPFVVKERLR